MSKLNDGIEYLGLTKIECLHLFSALCLDKKVGPYFEHFRCDSTRAEAFAMANKYYKKFEIL